MRLSPFVYKQLFLIAFNERNAKLPCAVFAYPFSPLQFRQECDPSRAIHRPTLEYLFSSYLIALVFARHRCTRHARHVPSVHCALFREAYRFVKFNSINRVVFDRCVFKCIKVRFLITFVVILTPVNVSQR